MKAVCLVEVMEVGGVVEVVEDVVRSWDRTWGGMVIRGGVLGGNTESGLTPREDNGST